MEQLMVDEHTYLRAKKKFPSVWCPGCGIGIVMGAIVRAVGGLDIEKDDVALVTGIGCTGRMSAYVDFHTIHTTHGRALAFATGLKLVRPEMEVIVVMGDGDALAIGGNHFIHAARRNVGLTAIVVNNSTYGMTGGQYSPATPLGAHATTAAYGHIERPFDIAALAEAAGAPFVARSTVYHALDMEKVLSQAIAKKGFSVVEVLSNCHVHYGKLNDMRTAAEMLKWLRDNTTSVAAARHGGAANRIVRGVLVDKEQPEYTEEYRKLVERVHAAAGGP